MAYGDFKGLRKRTAADKVLRGKAFNIVKKQKYKILWLSEGISFYGL